MTGAKALAATQAVAAATGAEVVQRYLHDRVAQPARPAAVPLRLAGDVREMGHPRRLVSLAAVQPASPPAPQEAHQ